MSDFDKDMYDALRGVGYSHDEAMIEIMGDDVVGEPGFYGGRTDVDVADDGTVTLWKDEK